MKNIIYLLLITIIACNPQKQEENITSAELPPEERAEKALQEEVIAIHDEVMPKMDKLMRLKGKIQIKIDSLRNSESQDTQRLTMLLEKTNNLRKADSAMMNWMRQFKPVKDSVSHAQRMQYLILEKERIEKVREMMNGAIEDADKTIN